MCGCFVYVCDIMNCSKYRLFLLFFWGGNIRVYIERFRSFICFLSNYLKIVFTKIGIVVVCVSVCMPFILVISVISAVFLVFPCFVVVVVFVMISHVSLNRCWSHATSFHIVFCCCCIRLSRFQIFPFYFSSARQFFCCYKCIIYNVCSTCVG